MFFRQTVYANLMTFFVFSKMKQNQILKKTDYDYT